MKRKLLHGTDLFDVRTIENSRVALIANHTSIDKNGQSILSKYLSEKINVTAVFSLEHGFFPVAQDMESVGKENKVKGVPVYSLYGGNESSLRPDRSHFNEFDVVIYDIQDVGSRYYTYLASLAMFMDLLEGSGKKLVVLDRINPIGGKIEGSMLQVEKYQSFVGYFPLMHRHGLTSAEFANYYYKSRKFTFDLEIVKIQGWTRDSYFDEYDYPWIPTSPNMPTVDAALLYPGGCLIEGTEISEGRGTTFPFQVVGKESIDPFKLKKELDRTNIQGVSFAPLEFRPMFQKCAMKRCGGVYITLTDREKAQPFRAYIQIMQVLRKMLGDTDFFRTKAYEFIEDVPAIELLLGDEKLIDMFYNFADFREIDSYLTECEKNAEEFFKEFLFY